MSLFMKNIFVVCKVFRFAVCKDIEAVRWPPLASAGTAGACSYLQAF